MIHATIILPTLPARRSTGGGHRHGPIRDVRGGRLWLLILSSVASLCHGAPAMAQTATVLIPPVIDPDYKRDRNVSVRERIYPDYSPLGIDLGGFTASPSLKISPSFSDNIYRDNNRRVSDFYVVIEPYVALRSNWSNHRTLFEAGGDIERYTTQTLRNQNGWYLHNATRLDVKSDLNVTLDGRIGRNYESPYSEDVSRNQVVPSSYLRKSASVKTVYGGSSRARLTGALEYSDYVFSPVKFANGFTREQTYRDRSIVRATALGEYALSPSIATYGELAYDHTHYPAPAFGGGPNRSSNGYAVISGVNFDLAGVARGSVGIGYSAREYDTPAAYRNAHGVSVQANLDFFPSELTTVSLTVQRQLQDVSLGTGGAYWDNRIGVSLDHELLRNLILSTNASYILRDYIENSSRTDVWQIGFNGDYTPNRFLKFGAAISYGSSRPNDIIFGNRFDELRTSIYIRSLY